MATLDITTDTRQPLQMSGGDDYDLTVIYKDDNGVAIDLTGMTFSWTFTIGITSVVATIGAGLTVTAAQGKIVLHLTAAQTTTFSQGLGKHRLRLLTPTKKTLMRGAIVNDT